MSMQDSNPTPQRSFFAFIQDSLRSRLTAIIIGAALIPVIVISLFLGFNTYAQMKTALVQDAFDKLAAVQTIKRNQINTYLKEAQGDLVAVRETAAAIRQEALAKLQTVNTLKGEEIIKAFSVWDADVRDVASDPSVIEGMSSLSSGYQQAGSIYLRSLYAGRSDLETAFDESFYSVAHYEQHGFFRGYINIHGYEDALLIDTLGNVVYSTQKNDFFGTNLVSGPYRESNLAGLYQTLLQTPADQSVVTDMGSILDQTTAFIGTPIYQTNTLVGMLVYQLPVAQINAIVQNRTGLTASAETYLIGSVDGQAVLRSDRIVKDGVIGDLKPGTDSERALAGETGSDFRVGSTGVYEVGVFAPLNIPGLNWGIVTSATVQEIFVPTLPGRQNDFFTEYQQNYGFYDIFLISPEGFTFYTVQKDIDYQVNLLTDNNFNTTNLATLVTEILDSKSYEFADFSYYAPDNNAPAAFFGIPLVGVDGEVEMIIVAQVDIASINTIMEEATGLGQSGETYLIGPNLLWRNDSRHLSELNIDTTVLNEDFKVDTVASRSAIAGNSGQEIINDYNGTPVLSVWSPLAITESENSTDEGLIWAVIAEVDESEALAPVNQLAGAIAIAVILGILIVGALAIFVGTRLALNFTNPILALTNTAAKVAEGDLELSAEVKSRDEIGVLANAFNKMTSQLRDLIGSLETRVEERTSDLRLAAQIGQTVSQVSDLETMLKQATRLIQQQFDLYYVQIYLTDAHKATLLLKSGTGEVGEQLVARHHSLPLNTASINGRAAMEKRAVIIADTEKSQIFRKNLLLPETRGEMAIPLIVGNQVVGVLDIQTRYPGKLSDESLAPYEALAGQLAVAIQNANLLEQAEQARVEVETQARRQVRRNWNTHMDAIHKPEHIGFSFDRDKITELEGDAALTPSANNKILESPISWIGEEIGSLIVEIGEENKNEQTAELVNIVARQVAQQLENLRLLENAERYLNDAQQATRRQTREGWEEYIKTRNAKDLGFFYDTQTVSPHDSKDNTEDIYTLPLKARDILVGKLTIEGLAADDNESRELAGIVAERLSAHLENLRLSEQTRQSLAETAEQTERLGHLNDFSEALSQAATLDDIYKTCATMLPNIIDAARFSMTHPVPGGAMLEVFALQGESGAIPTGTKLPIEGTAIGTCFTERRGVIDPDLSENTYKESGLLAKQGLKSTLSVPLVVAGEAIGTINLANTRVRAYSTRDQDLAVQAASHMASAIENRQQYQRAQKQADREAMLNTISQKIQSATSVEAVLQIAARELGHALGAPMTVAQLSIKDQE